MYGSTRISPLSNCELKQREFTRKQMKFFFKKNDLNLYDYS
jgi:hypothetical protein